MRSAISSEIRKESTSSLILLIIVAASIVQFGIWRMSFIFPSAVILAFCYFLLYSGRIWLLFNRFKKIFILILTLICCSIFSSVYQFSIDTFIVYSFFVAAFSVVLGISYFIAFNAIIFLKTFSFIVLLIYIFSYIYGFSFLRFCGIFDNPNGMGRFASVILGIYAITFFCVEEKISYFNKILFLTILVVSIISLFISNSRCSLVSVIIPLFFIFCGYVVDIFSSSLKRKRTKIGKLNSLLNFLIFLGTIAYLLYFLNAYDGIIEKFQVTLMKNDLTNGRISRWSQVTNIIDFFGQGYGVFDGHGFADVHNNYLNQALIFGIFPALIFFMLFFYLFVSSFLILRKHPSIEANIAFFSFFYFIIYSLFETGASIFVVWIGIIFYGKATRDYIIGIKRVSFRQACIEPAIRSDSIGYLLKKMR